MTMLNHVYTVDAATALDADAIRHIHARGYVRTNAALFVFLIFLRIHLPFLQPLTVHHSLRLFCFRLL